MELHEGGNHEQHSGAHWERLAPGVARRRLPGWDATAGVVAGTTDVLVVDTGGSPQEGADIRRGATELFGLPVTHVALTHPHFDHVLGTSAFPGAAVHGTAGNGDELLRDAVAYGVPAGAARDAVERPAPPARAVDGELELDLGGGRRVRLVGLGPAHSPDDLVVLVPGPGNAPAVVFCGDLVEESGEPQAGPDASPERWPAALDRLLELGGEDAVYVPGHGAAVDARFVREQRNALARRFGVS
ncbi:MBL fold metallo-hydrolase [Streptomyces sp. AV19]|uniref:MBL fold metallo-hydrolase n=1 Tax=Streptomyces sp. AV19 TaxID=2793068 RepID=UPI0018FE37C7|nr:MBL fold metallo-hydrolase [Streptomyces sp. AV19]MBH1933147.1 MBL fold metallo-hydrolase [Streptomyces sp. AV19]MDG4531863.1 MBL fold metallo-hydrolase [Streptomyces sp. AV19]